MRSKLSTALTRTVGVDVSAVDRRGSGLFKPQSPLERDEGGVARAAWVGYGNVAESGALCIGLGRGGGRLKRREVRSRAAVGEETALDDMVVVELVKCEG